MPRKTDRSGKVDTAIGLKVAELRIASGLSREQLASHIGVTHQQLQKYEKGTNRITLGRMVEIAHALGEPIEYFFSGFADTLQPSKHRRLCIEVSRNFMRIKSPEHQIAVAQLCSTLASG